ncbi:MAG: hypothetical protein DHS20C09_19640 [marine bacterium B5-7]|nr:MAG: hypothetical protein DHS20C09_19640 [marine bacterium B5-7]
MNKTNDVQSPCVKNCCLNEDDICMGCFRTITEIVGWSESNSEERETILLMAKQRENKLTPGTKLGWGASMLDE